MSKLGIVMAYFTHGMCNVFEKLSREDFIRGTAFLGNALPYKFAGVHFCFEHNTFSSLLQTTLMMSLGKYARIRLRSHCGKEIQLVGRKPIRFTIMFRFCQIKIHREYSIVV